MPMTDEEWERWQKRLLSAALAVVAVGALVNEFFIQRAPRESVFVAVVAVLGLPFVLGAASRRGKDD